MTELDLLKEEIKDIEGDLFRIRGSLQKQDNGVKLSRIAIKTRTLDRLKALAKRENAA
ncbi:hypothetical protein [Aliirhizobium cellulosilyticum]|uniref:Uncharacterized protein n=1 Tax=Aliirhizobium cellulosilyticum TaxID=393664 RepID=A0A7W6X955_9HYPH|nr:hypothetical protein [Rhizobium cellulosilyticum]MBB4347977.1 hypothetical protein [Rhizobium cellulosilyticum]MBB4409629.1 hypothetical protein [Rhizobium cellulosilyticum]MBB4444317.1 hypothetical protein [Rhizobium cellulosilyticum]